MAGGVAGGSNDGAAIVVVVAIVAIVVDTGGAGRKALAAAGSWVLGAHLLQVVPLCRPGQTPRPTQSCLLESWVFDCLARVPPAVVHEVEIEGARDVVPAVGVDGARDVVPAVEVAVLALDEAGSETLASTLNLFGMTKSFKGREVVGLGRPTPRLPTRVNPGSVTANIAMALSTALPTAASGPFVMALRPGLAWRLGHD